MQEAEKQKNRLLIVPVVAFVHYILVLFVFYSAFLLSKSTVKFWHAIGNALHVVHRILLFPRAMLVELIPSINVALLPILLTSLLWKAPLGQFFDDRLSALAVSQFLGSELRKPLQCLSFLWRQFV